MKIYVKEHGARTFQVLVFVRNREVGVRTAFRVIYWGRDSQGGTGTDFQSY